ncbi:MAG: bifunctional oligoribonuclease/PAP phosphatase NrnA [Muribaculaceae bacterium]|nr:bifunctional oligoribonuclease/PAP phosphatase NrnA [Muribaculaceae bacterium]
MFDQAQIEQIKLIRDYISTAHRAVVTCHMSPDGDAMGSSLALCRVLNNMGVETRVITPDEPNHNLLILPGTDNVIWYTRFQPMVEKCLSKADIIFCLDYNDLKRVDRLEDSIRKSSAVKIMIDHHLYPNLDSVSALISCPERSSTCSLLYSVLSEAGMSEYVDEDVATCILAGMMTDTNNFSHNANHPEDYLIVSHLVSQGADKNKLYNQLFNTFSESCLRLNGYALSHKMEVYNQYHAALIWLTRDELNEYKYKKGDTEGLVNRPLSIPGVIYSAYLREESDFVKVSMRSVGDFPVNIVCEKYFGGGGHLNAAGGEYHGTLNQAVDLFKSLLSVNMQYIEK